MNRDIEIACRCGKVHGWVRGVSPSSANRVICYCDDCQAAAHYLGYADALDAHGGSDIVQFPPAALRFDRGTEHIACLRLSPKGLHRWHASCCNTPLGNTVGPAVPVVGVVVQALGHDARERDEVFGPPVARILGKFAVGEPPPGSEGLPLRLIARTARLIAGWKLRGRGRPHPYFDDATGAPRYPMIVLTREQRDALRPLCGPRPAR